MLLTCNKRGQIRIVGKCIKRGEIRIVRKWSCYPEQKQHEGLDGHGSPDDATEEPVAADQHPRVQVVIAERSKTYFWHKLSFIVLTERNHPCK